MKVLDLDLLLSFGETNFNRFQYIIVIAIITFMAWHHKFMLLCLSKDQSCHLRSWTLTFSKISAPINTSKSTSDFYLWVEQQLALPFWRTLKFSLHECSLWMTKVRQKLSGSLQLEYSKNEHNLLNFDEDWSCLWCDRFRDKISKK